MPPNPQSDKPKLLEEVRRLIRTKHYSRRTEETYCDWIRRFILHHGKRHPRDMGGPEVAGFLSYLANERDVAASAQNDTLTPFAYPSGPASRDLSRAAFGARLRL